MYKTLTDVNKIIFPLYRPYYADKECVINSTLADGVLFDSYGRVIDDRNMPGATLGIRRAQSSWTNISKLKLAALDVKDLLCSKHKIFVDSQGNPFRYEKTRTEWVRYYEIERVDLKETFSTVKLKGITHPFKVPRPPGKEAKFAQVLHYKGVPWFIYSFAEFWGKDFRKKV